ncbi:MAG: type II 3-dehydroquinate dehydratase [Paludibacteraceae bacterium]
MLGRREPEIYGSMSMERILTKLQRAYPDVWIDYRQSNHEGDLIDWIQAIGTDSHYAGIVLNAGGYTHTSVAIRDAICISEIPIVEVHISDITKREAFRKTSLLTDVCSYTIMGIGTLCYQEAVKRILEHAENH